MNDFYQMQFEKQQKRKASNKRIIKWFAGLFLLIISIPVFSDRNLFSGFLILVTGLFCLPIVSDKVNLPSALKYAIVLLVPFFAFSLIPSKATSEVEDSAPDLPTKSEGYVIARNFVEQNLKSPSSADFVGGYQGDFYSDSTYVYIGQVDAVNSFNANIRSNWRVEMKFLGGEWASQRNWRLINISIE